MLNYVELAKTWPLGFPIEGRVPRSAAVSTNCFALIALRFACDLQHPDISRHIYHISTINPSKSSIKFQDLPFPTSCHHDFSRQLKAIHIIHIIHRATAAAAHRPPESPEMPRPGGASPVSRRRSERSPASPGTLGHLGTSRDPWNFDVGHVGMETSKALGKHQLEHLKLLERFYLAYVGMVYHIPSKVSAKKLLQASAGTKRSHFCLRPAPIILETMACPYGWVQTCTRNKLWPVQVQKISESHVLNHHTHPPVYC